MNKRIDLIGSLAFVALGIVILVVAVTYPPPGVRFDSIGPMGFPTVIGSLFVIGGLFQSVRSFLFIRRFGVEGPSEGTDDDEGHPASGLRGLLFIVGSFAYILLLPIVGYLILTPLAIYGALWSLNFGPWWKRVLVGVIFSILGFVVFGLALNVPLPQGPLGELLYSISLVDSY